jgi:hypothetical protein
MIFGQVFSSGFGNPEHHVATFVAKKSGMEISCSIIPATNFGDGWFGLYANSIFQRSCYIAEGSISAPIFFSEDNGDTSVVVLRQGHSDVYDQSRVARIFDEMTSKKATISWDWTEEVLEPVTNSDGTDDAYLSNWVLSELSPTLGHEISPTRRVLDVDLSVTAGVATVVVGCNSTDICTGTGAVGTTITLVDSGFGVSGTVDVSAGAVSEAGKTLSYRYPRQQQILRGLVSPPTVVIDTVDFNSRDNETWTEPASISEGTFYYAIRSISDTGTVGTASSPMAITIQYPPEPPTAQAYGSGVAGATTVTFTPSTTTGASYRAYLQRCDDDFMDMVVPAATAVAGATSIVLPAITGYPGIASVLVRAVSPYSGIEEKNGVVVQIEYDAAGVRVEPRPNTARITSATAVGLTAEVDVIYPTAGEAGVATTVALFSRTPDGTYDYTTPDATESLSGTTSKYATLTATLVAGRRLFVVRAVTAAGTQSANNSSEAELYLTAAVTVGATNISVTNTRG